REEDAAPALEPKLASAVEALASDELVHEYFRMLVDGIDQARLLPKMEPWLKRAKPDVLSCAYVRTQRALAELKSASGHGSVRAAVEALSSALGAELAARKIAGATAK